MNVSVFSRICEVPREEWNSLIRTNVFATHGWLKTVEETFIGDVRPLYIVLRQDGRTVGATVCHTFHQTATVEDLDDHFLGRIKPLAARLGISFMPAIVCGPLWGYGDHVSVEAGAGPERTRTVMNALLDVVEREAGRSALPISVINVPEEDGELCAVLRQRGYNCGRHVPVNYLDVRWSSFTDYAKHLDDISPHAKKDLKKKLNRNRKSGTTISTLDTIGQDSDRLHELVTMTYRKHANLPFCFNKDFFCALRRNLDANASVHVARKGSEITGALVTLRSNGASFIHLIGVDHEKCGNDMTYFVLGYYAPINEAIDAGLTRLCFGPGQYFIKRRIGCRTANLFMWHKGHRRMSHELTRLWFVMFSAWNMYKLPRHMREHASAGPDSNEGRAG